MQIQSLGYDPEADELDLLIDNASPVAAESVPVGEGILIRRDPDSGQVVGATIRGYSHFRRKVRLGLALDSNLASVRGYAAEFQAIVQWQKNLERLSQQLMANLGIPERQQELLNTLFEPRPIAAAAREASESYQAE